MRPVVARASQGLPVWLLVAAAAILGLLLFSVLDARRRALTAPPVRPRVVDTAGTPSAPPALFIPPAPRIIAPEPIEAEPPPAPPAPSPAPAPQPEPRIVYVPQPQPAMPPVAEQQPRAAGGSVLVVDTTTPDADGPGIAAPAAAGPAGGAPAPAIAVAGSRARAGQLRHRATTVPQGTLIPAVLETALDSTRPGQARALVSRDVRGFDGSKVLIPRGSRLFGEYRADLAPGQNRAFVQWSRLVRPDGVTIAIGSPAADALGRAGIKGSVNSHFLERFGAAILQSTLDIGVNLATAQLGNSPVIVLPNQAQSLTAPLIGTRQVQPTLKVKQGARVTVFVARDLDFTAVETVRR